MNQFLNLRCFALIKDFKEKGSKNIVWDKTFPELGLFFQKRGECWAFIADRGFRRATESTRVVYLMKSKTSFTFVVFWTGEVL